MRQGCRSSKAVSQAGFQGLTGSQDAINELLPGDLPVLVLVDAPEEIHDPGFLVVHPAHVFLPPDVKVKVGKLLQLEGKPREGQWGKCQRSSTHRTTPTPALGELPALPFPARPPGKVDLDLSRQFPGKGCPN